MSVMRHGLSARAALLTGLATAALAVCCAPAMAQMNVKVTIRQPNGGPTKSISVDDIANPEIDARYAIRSPGKTRYVDVKDGVSIRQLLEAADVDQAYSEIEIPYVNASQGSFRLTRDTINDPQLAPVIYVDKHGVTRFLRGSSGPKDYNDDEDFEVLGTFSIKQFRKSNLKVNVTADRKKIDPGESVRFTATVSNGGKGENYVYSWNFSDGAPSEGPAKRRYTFEKRGSYNVVVTARIAGSDVSQPAPTVKIVVGDPEESDKDRDGGGTNTSGGSDGGASDGSSGYGGSSTVTPSTPSPSYTPVTPPTPSPDPPTPPDIATSGPTISGNLLADASDPPQASVLDSAAKAAREGTPKDDDPEGASVSTAALGIAGLFGLLALGAGLELRHGGTASGRRRLRLRLPRRAA